MFKKSISWRQAESSTLTRFHGNPPRPMGTDGPADGRTRPGKERFETTCPRPGLEITISDMYCPSGFKVGFEIDQAPVSLSFVLSGPVRTTIQHPKKETVLERQTGNCLFAYLPGTRGTTQAPPGRFSGISVHMSMPVVKQLFPGLPNRSGSPVPVSRMTPMNWENRLILDQIFHCPYAGDTRKVFLEAKALELMARHFAVPDQAASDSFSELNPRELERTRQAYQTLISQLENPPGLEALGTMVGLNRNKLNQGFRQLYGGTVFCVLRDVRLTTALTLLRDTQISLAEIALRVGYSDQANFSNAFRRRFGLSPKKLRPRGGDCALAPETVS